MYLENGLVEYSNSEKLRRKQIRLQFGEDFLEWWGDFAQLDTEENRVVGEIKSSGWQQFQVLYKDFLSRYDIEKKEYSVKRFKKALETAAQVWEIELLGRRNWQNNGLWEYQLANRVAAKPAPVVDSNPVPHEPLDFF